MDDDVNRVLFALREPLGMRGTAGGSLGRSAGLPAGELSGRLPGRPAGEALHSRQRMAACLMRLAQATDHGSKERGFDGFPDANGALARLGVREHLHRLHPLPRAT